MATTRIWVPLGLGSTKIRVPPPSAPPGSAPPQTPSNVSNVAAAPHPLPAAGHPALISSLTPLSSPGDKPPSDPLRPPQTPSDPLECVECCSRISPSPSCWRPCTKRCGGTCCLRSSHPKLFDPTGRNIPTTPMLQIQI
eukprot:1185197-Prorocentrum_minimum.AAC.1